MNGDRIKEKVISLGRRVSLMVSPQTHNYHQLPSTTINYHQLQINYHQLPSTTINYLHVASIAVCFHLTESNIHWCLPDSFSQSIPRPTADDDRYSNSCKQCAYLSRKTTRVPRSKRNCSSAGFTGFGADQNLSWEPLIVGLDNVGNMYLTPAGSPQLCMSAGNESCDMIIGYHWLLLVYGCLWGLLLYSL